MDHECVVWEGGWGVIRMSEDGNFGYLGVRRMSEDENCGWDLLHGLSTSVLYISRGNHRAGGRGWEEKKGKRKKKEGTKNNSLSNPERVP